MASEDGSPRGVPGPLQPYVERAYEYVRGDESAKQPKFEVLEGEIDDDDVVVVDAGAHTGTSVPAILASFPDASIHLVEPLPDHVEAIREKYGGDDGVVIHPVAAGPNERRVDFNVLEDSERSSVLEPNGGRQEGRDGRESGRSSGDVVEKIIKVRQNRIDNLVDSADVLKLDVQGYEEQAIRGAAGILPSLSAVVLEVTFVPQYEGQALFSDVNELLEKRGFNLYDFFDHVHDPDGQLVSADAVFVKNDGLERNE